MRVKIDCEKLILFGGGGPQMWGTKCWEGKPTAGMNQSGFRAGLGVPELPRVTVDEVLSLLVVAGRGRVGTWDHGPRHSERVYLNFFEDFFEQRKPLRHLSTSFFLG